MRIFYDKERITVKLNGFFWGIIKGNFVFVLEELFSGRMV